MTDEIYIRENESPDDYRIRLYTNKELYGLNNYQIGDLLNEVYHTNYDESTYRKKTRSYLNGYNDATNKKENSNTNAQLLEELKKERTKLQALNIERNRFDRLKYRQELFYEQCAKFINVADQVKLNSPEDLDCQEYKEEKSYLLAISDMHYGYEFCTQRNFYNPDVCKSRLEYLLVQTKKFCQRNNVKTLNVLNLGDTIHGILRISDLQVNNSGILKATIEVSKLIGEFLLRLSEFIPNIEYYHVPQSNHTQIRPLGTRASEIASEDIEYFICEYLKIYLKDNNRISINTDEESPYIRFTLSGWGCIAEHGHDIKNVYTAHKDVSYISDSPCDFLFLGHFHKNEEINAGLVNGVDIKTFICPSLMGTDPYADRILKGSAAAAKMFVFNALYGYVGSEIFTLQNS